MKRIIDAFLGTLHGKTGAPMLSKWLGILGALAILPAVAQMTAPQITLTTLHSFAGGSDGSGPGVGVVIGPGGVLYGATNSGGTSNYGTAYSLTPPASPGGSWTKNTLYNFTGVNDGAGPSHLVIGSNGRLYGTAAGYVVGPSYQGTVFSLTPPASPGGSWTETTLHIFTCGDDGCIPSGGLVIGKAGALYGTTFYGGPTANGTVFSVTPPASPGGSWTEAVLHSFSGSDGSGPYAGVVIGSGGVLYGTTQYGGTSFSLGTVFSVTPPSSAGGLWTETVLHSFVSADRGQEPAARVVIGAGGALCSTTIDGGASNDGTVFCLRPPASPGDPWTEVVLHSFDGSDGANPVGAVVIGPGHVLYGTTSAGGASNNGTVYQLTL
jgi:uncharacterized repeat protein (TIGR03803 family)